MGVKPLCTSRIYAYIVCIYTENMNQVFTLSVMIIKRQKNGNIRMSNIHKWNKFSCIFLPNVLHKWHHHYKSNICRKKKSIYILIDITEKVLAININFCLILPFYDSFFLIYFDNILLITSLKILRSLLDF